MMMLQCCRMASWLPVGRGLFPASWLLASRPAAAIRPRQAARAREVAIRLAARKQGQRRVGTGSPGFSTKAGRDCLGWSAHRFWSGDDQLPSSRGHGYLLPTYSPSAIPPSRNHHDLLNTVLPPLPPPPPEYLTRALPQTPHDSRQGPRHSSTTPQPTQHAPPPIKAGASTGAGDRSSPPLGSAGANTGQATGPPPPPLD
jgi:hypothetical protein